MHYSALFFSVNSVISVFTLNVGHFMHSTVTTLITHWKGRGFQTLMLDVYNPYIIHTLDS